MKIKWFITVIFSFGILLYSTETLSSDEYIIKSQKEYFTIEKHSVLQNNNIEWKTTSYKKTHYIVSIVKPLMRFPNNSCDNNAESLKYQRLNFDPFCYLSSSTDLIINLNGFDAENIVIYDIMGNRIHTQEIHKKSDLVSIAIDKFISGVYFVVLTSEDNKKNILNFVKN